MGLARARHDDDPSQGTAIDRMSFFRVAHYRPFIPSPMHEARCQPGHAWPGSGGRATVRIPTTAVADLEDTYHTLSKPHFVGNA
jgi:hypothetical protein